MDRPTAAGPGIVSVANETTSSYTRITKEGKTLRYEMRIIQQPQRARACGAGAKASADRRPVDPAPIIQLKVFELIPHRSEEEITLTIPANYFVFATLERGRQVAQPRNSQDADKVLVLTGTSVAGAQIFDRPDPAIYFVFPDLSVRHEGKYRLTFSLYEQLKRSEDDDSRPDQIPNPSEEYVTQRMEVKSIPFDVYSAKRFPGLTESTSLSRTFAEQGCRIRIRRDVRMRRRDTKQGKDWDDYDNEDQQQQQQPHHHHHHHSSQLSRLPSHTPDPYGHPQLQGQGIDPIRRPRSTGQQSHHSLHASVSRRTSLNDLNHPYQPPPHTPQHVAFSQPSPYNPSPVQQYSQPSYMQPPPPPPHFPQHSYQHAPSASVPASQQQSYYGYASAPLPANPPAHHPHYPTVGSSYDSNAYHMHRTSGDYSALQPDVRRPSLQSSMPQTSQSMYNNHPSAGFAPQQPQSLHPDAQSNQAASHQHHTSIDAYATRTAPPEPVQPPTRVTTPTPPPLSAKSSFGTTLPPLATSFPNAKLEAASPSSTAPSSAFPPSLSTPIDTNKRPYGSTFPTSWQNISNKHGARPADLPSSSTFLAADTDTDDGGSCVDSMTRFYKRACGRTIERQMP